VATASLPAQNLNHQLEVARLVVDDQDARVRVGREDAVTCWSRFDAGHPPRPQSLLAPPTTPANAGSVRDAYPGTER
jgi:hypothetical protein